MKTTLLSFILFALLCAISAQAQLGGLLDKAKKKSRRKSNQNGG
jgi:hypothetical protein